MTKFHWQFRLLDLLLASCCVGVCVLLIQRSGSFPAVSTCAILIGASVGGVLSGKWRGWLVGALLGFGACALTDRVGLEYYPRKGAVSLPVVAYIIASFLAGALAGFAVNLDGCRCPNDNNESVDTE